MKKSPLPSRLKNIPEGYVYLGLGKEVVLPEEWSTDYPKEKSFLQDWGWSFHDLKDSIKWNLVHTPGLVHTPRWTKMGYELFFIALKDSALHRLQPDYGPKKSGMSILKEENARLKEHIKKLEEWAANMPKMKS